MSSYTPSGVCSKKISFDVKQDKLHNVSFESGCPGNLFGISQLVEGMDIYEAIKRLQGIKCGAKSTSCPDQLSKALVAYIEENNN
ncbi:TIGR03905 family TSCPD domain-containing protein [Alkaliphilus sp. B6464]|uniref:TIGR03905 family TSCPD domain-containing protein n=1 Tax=Alkaliphilus sp. B6464 TaxID=2731219 RepID=UPI001BA9373C|nr:TIGR03905 family TSCPD domain-containing protein [Alkaliphilus sp. B6464]QUH19557.1 TIGR03905 family TSCPD domain-containing protein [Alkaliphilus sp. B6464]